MPPQVLRRADVHHGQGRATRCHGARHAHRVRSVRAGLQLQLCRATAICRQAQGLQGRRVEKHRGRRQHGQPLAGGKGAGHECGRHGRQQQRIGPHHPQHHAGGCGRGCHRWCGGWWRGGLCGRWGIHLGHGGQLQPGAGTRHLRVVGQLRIKRFGQRALHGAQLQIGLAVHGAHGLRKLIEGRGVDHMHGKGQRYAQHHGGHCGGAAPGMVAQLLPGEGAKQCKHDPIVTAQHRHGRPLRQIKRNRSGS